MAHENLIANCITISFRGEENNSPAEIWADSIVRAALAGFLLENVDAADPAAVAAEVSNYLVGLAELGLDDLNERLKYSTVKKEKDAVIFALQELSSIKKAARAGLIDENEVLKLVIENIAEFSGD